MFKIFCSGIMFFFDVIVCGMDFLDVIYVIQMDNFSDCEMYIYCFGCIVC